MTSTQTHTNTFICPSCGEETIRQHWSQKYCKSCVNSKGYDKLLEECFPKKYREKYERILQYNRENMVSITELGSDVITCPVCGEKGYRTVKGRKNKITGTITSGYVSYVHIRTVDGKPRITGSCYIGKEVTK